MSASVRGKSETCEREVSRDRREERAYRRDEEKNMRRKENRQQDIEKASYSQDRATSHASPVHRPQICISNN